MVKTADSSAPPVESRGLAARLRHAILEGKYHAAKPFPSLREIAKQYDTGVRVSRNAVDLLVREGLLFRRERSGTFVRLSASGGESAPASCPLRCVNIIERPSGTLPAFVRMDYLRGYTQALETHNVKMRVARSPAGAGEMDVAFSPQYPFREQGCVLVNIVDRAVFDWLSARGVTFVVQNYTQYDKAGLPPHHSVAINKVGGAFAATRRLIDLGHRRIGYVGNSPADSDDLLEVYEGYAAAMRCAGLEPRAEDTAPINTDEPHMAMEPALRWLQGRSLPTAMVARTDAAAIGLLRAAQSLGIRVPEDLSVIGFNDQDEAETTEPPLTTVAVPRLQLGRVAVETLLEVAESPPDEPVTRIVECHLVERGSVAPPRARSRDRRLAGARSR